jgi:hypothetical protein
LKIIRIVVFLALLVAFVGGFLHTWEPGEAGQQLAFRFLYATGILLAIRGIIRTLKKAPASQ